MQKSKQLLNNLSLRCVLGLAEQVGKELCSQGRRLRALHGRHEVHQLLHHLVPQLSSLGRTPVHILPLLLRSLWSTVQHNERFGYPKVPP